MSLDDRIIVELSRDVCNRIASRVIRDLQRMPFAKLSGNDSPLANTWDEICVDVQYERSFAWDVYEEVMRATIRYYLESLQAYEKVAVWLCTGGADIGNVSEDMRIEDVPCCYEDMEHHVLTDFILVSADTWSNRRIRRVLANF